MSDHLLDRATRRRNHKIARLLGVPLADVTRAVVLAIGGIKGGIGKSTTAIYLAHVWAGQGLKVLVICADPGSGTSRKWNKRARELGHALPFTVKAHPSEDLEDRILEEEWHLEYDLIIVDTGGDDDRILRAAYRIADYMLLTASPSPVDLDTLADSARTAIGQGNEARTIPASILLTGVKSPRMAEDAKAQMREAGIPVLSNVITHRTAYQNAYIEGVGRAGLLDYPAVQHELDNP
ncbi:nucleotide-binding protein [Streptomyces longwoodensis]|uniref:nucleotide-binding protein n=1 Tax=Streptomyces longwoodensis TaxID=68231 RepID=UPI0036FDEC91